MAITASNESLITLHEVTALRFLLRQPSPNWKSFSINDITVYRDSLMNASINKPLQVQTDKSSSSGYSSAGTSFLKLGSSISPSPSASGGLLSSGYNRHVAFDKRASSAMGSACEEDSFKDKANDEAAQLNALVLQTQSAVLRDKSTNMPERRGPHPLPTSYDVATLQLNS